MQFFNQQYICFFFSPLYNLTFLLFSLSNCYYIFFLLRFFQPIVPPNIQFIFINLINQIHILLAMINPLHQFNIPTQQLKKLHPTDINQLYFTNQLSPQLGFFSKLRLLFSIDSHYDQLSKFYPFHNTITKSYQIYKEGVCSSKKEGILISAASILLLFQLGRRGIVLPFFRQYGAYFKTHRIFRQYLVAATLPTAALLFYNDWKHFENVSSLWEVHARRLANKVLTDPKGSEYSEDILLPKHEWINNFYSLRDIIQKMKSEVPLQECETYENPEFENVDLGEADVESEGDQQ